MSTDGLLDDQLDADELFDYPSIENLEETDVYTNVPVP